MPVHYGYWDEDGRPRAANELTITEWDAVSKQPHFKYAAQRSSGRSRSLDHVGDAAGAVASGLAHAAERVKEAVSFAGAAASDAQVDDYLGIALGAERALEEALRDVGERHAKEPDMRPILNLFADWSRQDAESLEPLIARYSANRAPEPRRLASALFHGRRSGGLGLFLRPPRPLAAGPRGPHRLGGPQAGVTGPPRRRDDRHLQGRHRADRPPDRLAPHPDRRRRAQALVVPS